MQTVQVSKIENAFSIDTAMPQVDYVKLRDAAGTNQLTLKDACAMVCRLFGFDASKVLVEEHAELNVYVGAGSTKKSGAYIPRPPIYNATDWHYIRFRVCGILWECVNDNLVQIAE